MNLVFRLFLAFNSTSMILLVYAVKKAITINHILEKLKIDWLATVFVKYTFGHSFGISIFLYFTTLVVLSWFSVWLSRFLLDWPIKIKADNKPVIISIQLVNYNYLPSYLGYFFVSLGVDNFQILIPIYIILFIFTLVSQSQYFNPIILLLRYNVYSVTTVNNVSIVVISKQKLKDPMTTEFENLKKINDFTFIDQEI